MHFLESTQQIPDDLKNFTVTILEAKRPTSVCVFAVGRGGNPLRHLALLRYIARQGLTVIAPHFEMLMSSVPTGDELNVRVRQLELALKSYSAVDQSIIGVGHSLGCVLLLTLAGGEAHTLSGHKVVSQSKWKFDKLALLAPPVDFFRHPSALDSVNTQMYLRVGNKDTITPPSQALLLKEMLAKQIKIEFIVDKDAGHFSYMDELPIHVKDSQPDRNIFLSGLAKDITHFVTSSS